MREAAMAKSLVGARQHLGWMTNIRRQLHWHPELSSKEQDTAARLMLEQSAKQARRKQSRTAWEAEAKARFKSKQDQNKQKKKGR